jgi:psiF repeat-containing protein
MSRIACAVSAVVLAGTLSLGVSFAQTPAPATTPAPGASGKAAAKQKKADCTKQAKEQKMTGAARTKFMKECTSKM